MIVYETQYTPVPFLKDLLRKLYGQYQPTLRHFHIYAFSIFTMVYSFFSKSVYWSKEQVEDTRKKSNQGEIQWKDDYDAMAMKTVIKSILSKGGILSGQMQEAYAQDMNGETQIISSDSSEKTAADTKTTENESKKGA